MTDLRRRSSTRSLVAALVVFSVVGPLHTFDASAATPCLRAQHIGAAPAWFRTHCRPAQRHTPASAPLHKAGRAELDLLRRVNAERQARGIAPLTLDARLSTFAQGWSATMPVSGFRHSDIRRLFEGRFNLVGENIAWASGGSTTAGVIHVMWMQSTGHRENMLNPAYDTIGIGVYCAANGTMWATQNFGRHNSLGAAPSSGIPPQNPIARQDQGTATC